MFNLTSLDGEKARFEGRIAKFERKVKDYYNEEKDVCVADFIPTMLLTDLYLKLESAKISIEHPNSILVSVGKPTIEKTNPRIGDVISFNAYVEELERDHDSEIRLKRLSGIKTVAKGDGQKFTDFWQNINRVK